MRFEIASCEVEGKTHGTGQKASSSLPLLFWWVVAGGGDPWGRVLGFV
jgi:hypothetical protein